MKPREMGGVVDSKLNVYGVDGLKVCDLSIAPGNVSAVCLVIFPQRKSLNVDSSEHLFHRSLDCGEGGCALRR